MYVVQAFDLKPLCCAMSFSPLSVMNKLVATRGCGIVVVSLPHGTGVNLRRSDGVQI